MFCQLISDADECVIGTRGVVSIITRAVREQVVFDLPSLLCDGGRASQDLLTVLPLLRLLVAMYIPS